MTHLDHQIVYADWKALCERYNTVPYDLEDPRCMAIHASMQDMEAWMHANTPETLADATALLKFLTESTYGFEDRCFEYDLPRAVGSVITAMERAGS